MLYTRLKRRSGAVVHLSVCADKMITARERLTTGPVRALSHGQKMVAHSEEFQKFSHAVLAKPDYAYVNPCVRIYYLRANSKYKASMNDPAQLAALRADFAFIQKLTRSFSMAHVPLLAGTDSVNPSLIGGFSLHDELEELVTSGLSPYEALRAATAALAEYLHQSDRWGTITVGKVADLVLLDANPLENIGNTRRINGVMVRGVWHTRAYLDAGAAALKADYAKMIETTPFLAALR